MSTTLVIGDSHDTPEHDKERFKALSIFISIEKPDNIVQIGDFLSLDSVSSHDKNNLRIREGKRLSDDIDSGKEAYNELMYSIHKYNERCRQQKIRQYNPGLYWFEGNHETRVRRYINENPVLEGMVMEEDLVGASKDGWEVIPYKEYVEIEGVLFTHIPMNKRNNQPISGEYVTRRAAEMHDQTVVFGHTHRAGVHTVKRVGKDYLVQGINVGWFGDYVPDYLEGNEKQCDWWSGIVVLEHYAYGKVDPEFISIDRIKALL